MSEDDMDDGQGHEIDGVDGIDGHDALGLDAVCLDAESAAAVDRFFNSGTTSGAADTRVAALLGLLDCEPGESGPTLADLVMLHIERAGHEPELCEEDKDALDAWVMAGGRSNAVPHDHRRRAAWHDKASAAVTGVHHDLTTGGLIERTLDRIQAEIDTQVGRMRLPSRSLPAIRLADIASIAAVLVLSVSLLIPATNAFRADAIRASCASNLAAAGLGLGLYANDHDDAMPVAGPYAGGPWWNVGEGPGHSNAANLFTLVRGGYAGLDDLACAGNDHAVVAGYGPDATDWQNLEQVSYSYRVVFGLPTPARLSEGRQVVVADRSPVVLAAVRRTPISPTADSPNHGNGQRVLFSDGSAEWMRSPVTAEGDNIWLPASVERLIDMAQGRRRCGSPALMGDETPEGPGDAFVGP